MDEVEGEVFGRYRLLEVLRSGSTGTVYKARDTMMGREVAVKVLSPELAADPGHRDRFQREVAVAARLNDPNILPVYEAGEIGGRLAVGRPRPPRGHRGRRRGRLGGHRASAPPGAGADGRDDQPDRAAVHRSRGTPGVAVASRDPANDRAVVVSDAAHNRVVKLLAHSTEQTDLPFSGLAFPSAVTLGRGGALFVVDRDNEQVLKLPWKATVPTVLPFVVGHPDDVAVDTNGNVYVTDSHENHVTKFVKASNTSITLPFTGVDHPKGIGVDTAGNVYVVDAGNNRVLELPPG